MKVALNDVKIEVKDIKDMLGKVLLNFERQSFIKL